MHHDSKHSKQPKNSMTTIAIPAFLHDVFGEAQTRLSLACILAGGVGAGAAVVGLGWPVFAARAWYFAAPAGLLAGDVAAGAVANFSRGTTAFYAARPAHRRVFLAVHVHLPAAAALLGLPLAPAAAVWAYAIAAAAAVDALAAHPDQSVVAGALLAAGLVAANYAWPAYAAETTPAGVALGVILSQLFLLKVVYSFAVNHHRP
ncbi:hypothetical protein BDR26DRAFT_894580 [Obelidium mucronatum]|nr:hypothetical protein BDR26DRAFT_894580 [Obelidium mucronatum]